ncbi:MAG: DNA-binding protein Alba [Candidatus Bathyarchaeia archaeon]
MAGRTPENVVLIGKKPVMNYVVACMTLFNSGVKQVTIRARGRAIPRAVDTVELLRRAFIKNLVIPESGISIGTQELTGQEGRRTNVSTIDITIAKP